MATVQEFMSRVVPWPNGGATGVINLQWTSPKSGGMLGRPFTKLDEFITELWQAMQRPGWVKDIYFCLSLQSTIGKNVGGRAVALRRKENAVALRAVWLDIDVKDPPKGYATLNDALDALDKFVAVAKLPKPSALVASGGGLHVYWISDKPLAPADWRPYAEGLKNLVLQHGLRCDAGLTTDEARVLRVPGTFNQKTMPPRPVKLLALAPTDYDFQTALGHVATAMPARVTAAVTETLCYDPVKFPKKDIPPEGMESLADGIRTPHETLPLDWVPLIEPNGCPFFVDALATGGKYHSQGLWNLTVLATTFLKDGHKLAHRVGNRHPGYTPESTEAMWDRKVKERDDRGLGWPGCGKIQSEGCKLCATCSHFGHIKSPLNLAPKIMPVVAAPFSATMTLPPNDLRLPVGYCVDPQGSGVIGELVSRPLGKGAFVDEFVPLFFSVIANPWAQKSPRGINFVASMDKGYTNDICVLQEDLAVHGDCLKSLARQGVSCRTAHELRIRMFLVHWLAKLNAEQAAQQAVPYGWYMNDGKPHGFVYGGHLMRDDKTDRPSGYGDDQLRTLYTPKGDLGPWFEALKLVTDQHRPALEAIVAASFAAPLMRTPAQYSGLVSAYGATSGNKSTAVKLGLAVWGHPKLTKEVPGSSQKSMLKKMGIVNNLPIYWDDLSDDEKQAKVGKTLMELTEGVEGNKLKSNREFQLRTDWQSLLIICSNLSMFDYFVKKNRSNAAGLMRLFEFEVPEAVKGGPGRRTSWDAERTVQELEHNYGHMGMLYSHMLADDPAGIDAYTVKIIEKFAKTVQVQNDERFWIAMSGTILAGATYANMLHATFNIPELELFLRDEFLKMRRKVGEEQVVGGSQGNTEELLTGFLKEYAGNTIWTSHMVAGAGRPKPVTLLNGPDQRLGRAIHIQWAVHNRMLRISKTELYKFFDREHVSTSMVMDGLRKHFGMTIPFVDLTATTSYQGGPEHVVQLPVPPGSPLESQMYAHSPQADRPTSDGENVAGPREPGAAS